RIRGDRAGRLLRLLLPGCGWFFRGWYFRRWRIAQVVPAERLVDLGQRLLLRGGQVRVGRDRGDDPLAVLGVQRVEQAGTQVHHRRGHTQRGGQLLEYLRAGLAQATLDLAQVRVADPRLRRELAQRDPRVAAQVP